MNIWANAVITRKGLALQSKLTQGNTLNITRAVTGAGYVPAAILQNQTDVTDIKQTMTFHAVSYPEEGKCAMPVRLSNAGLATGYTAAQVGIYASDPDEGEILYFIAQTSADEWGVAIPSETEMPGYSAEWTFYFQYGHADNVSVSVDPSNTINATQAQKMIDEAVGKIPTPDVSGQIETHNTSSAAHADIRKYVDQKIAAIPTPDVSGQINSHDSNSASHSDIREQVNSKAPIYTYGTEDLVAGETPLETGKLHFVYE